MSDTNFTVAEYSATSAYLLVFVFTDDATKYQLHRHRVELQDGQPHVPHLWDQTQRSQQGRHEHRVKAGQPTVVSFLDQVRFDTYIVLWLFYLDTCNVYNNILSLMPIFSGKPELRCIGKPKDKVFSSSRTEQKASTNDWNC